MPPIKQSSPKKKKKKETKSPEAGAKPCPSRLTHTVPEGYSAKPSY